MLFLAGSRFVWLIVEVRMRIVGRRITWYRRVTAGLTSWTTAPLRVGHARVRPGDVKLFLRDLFGDFPINRKRVGFGLIALLSITVTFFGLVAAAVLLMS